MRDTPHYREICITPLFLVIIDTPLNQQENDVTPTKMAEYQQKVETRGVGMTPPPLSCFRYHVILCLSICGALGLGVKCLLFFSLMCSLVGFRSV